MKFRRVRKKMIRKIEKFVCKDCMDRWEHHKKAKHEPCFDFLVCIDIVKGTK